MFGGYAADDWAKHGQFYGAASAFIFGVLPTLARFTAGGSNANIQYCGQAFAQLPNGFGFGGQARSASSPYAVCHTPHDSS